MSTVSTAPAAAILTRARTRSGAWYSPAAAEKRMPRPGSRRTGSPTRTRSKATVFSAAVFAAARSTSAVGEGGGAAHAAAVTHSSAAASSFIVRRPSSRPV